MKARIFISVLLLVLIAAIPVIAGKGGVKVSAVTVDCGDAKKETNVLTSGENARIWISVPSGANTDGLTYSINDQGTPVVNPTNLTVTSCGDGFFFGDITLPASKGTFTLVAENSDGSDIGADSFRLR